MYPGPVPAG
jgi:hypothetical protein